jgi:pimeloyl-ACP methyl ester carboxylesterase
MRFLIGALAILAGIAHAGESRYFDSDGVRLRYIIDGGGETVVLLHGFSGSSQGLYVNPGTFDTLVAAGYRVVALDQRGHGMSDKRYDASDYGLNMVEDVRRLLDHLDADRVHLVGYSMGARVSSGFLAAYPERLLTITLGGFGWPWQSPPTTTEAALAALSEDNVLPGNDIRALAAVRAGGSGAVLTPDEQVLRDNKIPAFAIIGDRDEVVPREKFEALGETMSNLESVTIPGTHAGPDGAPYKPIFAAKLVEFLAGN